MKANSTNKADRAGTSQAVLHTTLPDSKFADAPPDAKTVYETMLWMSVRGSGGVFIFRVATFLRALERRHTPMCRTKLWEICTWLESECLIRQATREERLRAGASRRAIHITVIEAQDHPDRFRNWRERQATEDAAESLDRLAALTTVPGWSEWCRGAVQALRQNASSML